MTRDIPRITASEFVKVLSRLNSFVLTSHVNPDGDALGSEYALYHLLRASSKDARIINTAEVPSNYAFLNDGSAFECYDAAKHDPVISQCDAVIILDVNASTRLKRMEQAVLASPAQRYVVDHHLDPLPFAHAYWINTEASSTAEMIFELFEHWNDAEMTYDVALGVYVGLMTDTGSFRFERTTPHVHRIAAALLEAGVNPTDVYRMIYDEFPVKRSQLLGQMLASMDSILDGHVTILSITREMMKSTGCTIEETDNLVNHGLSIGGVTATALLTETEDGIKISFRSRGDVTVTRLAQHFGGGGHAYAAGAHVQNGSLKEIRKRVKEEFGRMFRSS